MRHTQVNFQKLYFSINIRHILHFEGEMCFFENSLGCASWVSNTLFLEILSNNLIIAHILNFDNFWKIIHVKSAPPIFFAYVHTIMAYFGFIIGPPGEKLWILFLSMVFSSLLKFLGFTTPSEAFYLQKHARWMVVEWIN